MQHSVRYIVGFAAAVCVVCSIFVSGAAVLLKDRQEENKLIDRMSKVLTVAGLIDEDDHPPPQEIKQLFETNIKPIVVKLENGELAPDIDAKTYDQRGARSDPKQSAAAPANAAKVQRLPTHGLVYQVVEGDAVEALIFPIEGKGLWSTLYGFLALDKDAMTIKGITFYEHGETPGLGGEVDNPTWKAHWPGRKAFSENWEPKITVKKGAAGPVDQDPYSVDGLSGATITARGVSHLVQFWLSDDGYGPYLAKYRKEKGIR